MIELIGWTGVVICFVLMMYHRYMHTNHDQVYAYIRKKYTEDDDQTEFPSKEDHARYSRKYSIYTIFFACLLIILNFFR
ncbi:hypothetical protein SAMN05216326_10334 [Nitrosomonas marina]|uniref:Uncharacterized protein n=1 Tax=Nitrosomonas marina TaxID=917 RepID=A0A1H9Z0F7_9PROT|nr:hypothetical protein [Nitrosomonas marina]SES74938.1 hypothetical protein SAMN05216326_10334 [Nitrosomonas marina]